VSDSEIQFKLECFVSHLVLLYAVCFVLDNFYGELKPDNNNLHFSSHCDLLNVEN